MAKSDWATNLKRVFKHKYSDGYMDGFFDGIDNGIEYSTKCVVDLLDLEWMRLETQVQAARVQENAYMIGKLQYAQDVLTGQIKAIKELDNDEA